MPHTEAVALGTWFRRTAAARSGGQEIKGWTSARRYRTLLRDAANRADHLRPDDERLASLIEAHRFDDFYGEVMFIGGGPAVHNAKLESVQRGDDDGQKLLDAVIVAALSESAPGDLPASDVA